MSSPTSFWELYNHLDTGSKIAVNSLALNHALRHLAAAVAGCRGCDLRCGPDERRGHRTELTLQFTAVLQRETEIQSALRTLSCNCQDIPDYKRIPVHLMEGCLLRRAVAEDTLRVLPRLLSRTPLDPDGSTLTSDFARPAIHKIKQHDIILKSFEALKQTYQRWEQVNLAKFRELFPEAYMPIQLEEESEEVEEPCWIRSRELARNYLASVTINHHLSTSCKLAWGALLNLLQSIETAVRSPEDISSQIRQNLLSLLQREQKIQRCLRNREALTPSLRTLHLQSQFRAQAALSIGRCALRQTEEETEDWTHFQEFWLKMVPDLQFHSPFGVEMTIALAVFRDRGRLDRRVGRQDLHFFIESWQSKLQALHHLEIPRLIKEKEEEKCHESVSGRLD